MADVELDGAPPPPAGSKAPARKAKSEPDNPSGIAGEQKLYDDLKRSAGVTKGKRAVIIHLSKLQRENRPQYSLNSAETSLSTLVTQGATFYWLRNNDCALLYNANLNDNVRSGLVKLKFLFAGDPLIGDLYDPHTDPGLASWYDLESDHEFLFDLVSKMVADQEVYLPSGRKVGDKSVAKKKPRAPLTTATLDRVEKALAGADLSTHIRRQPICAVIGESTPEPLFTEIFVFMEDLREALMPNINLFSNPWLFYRLTQTLDKRILLMLMRKDDNSLMAGFSVNLNIQTILSDAFLNFDAALSAGRYGTVVLELRIEDILGDIAAFFFARDFVRQRGYRICIDGLTYDTLPLIRPAEIGADLLKLQWTDDLPQQFEDPANALAREIVVGAKGKVILSRCDNKESIAFGQELNITLFQGRAIDQAIRDATIKF